MILQCDANIRSVSVVCSIGNGAPEGENHGHRRDVQREKPRKRGNGELDVGANKVLVQSRQAAADEVLEYSLIENSAVHGRAAGS